VDAFPKRFKLVQLLRSVRSVEEAAETVIESPLLKVVPLTVPRVPVMYEAPTEVVATTWPRALVERTAEAMLVMVRAEVVATLETRRLLVEAVAAYSVPETDSAVEEEYVKRLSPVNELLSVSAVDDAAVMVMSDVPLKDVPLMVRAVCSAVAVDALPVRAPTKVVNQAVEPERSVVDAFPKRFKLVQLLRSVRSVEEAAETVIESPLLKVVPLTVPSVPVM
jgi:hypothetical protein